jgi:phosphatidylserine decarboxylase
MTRPIYYVDRLDKKIYKEKVYGGDALKLLYSTSKKFGWISKFILQPIFSKLPFFSVFYGWLQRLPSSKKKIVPFIKKYKMNSNEFLKPVSDFKNFNDFFIRKLKDENRPVIPLPDVAVLPADGRYLVYPNISKANGFTVKGKKFQLSSLLQNEQLASKYEQGGMVMARLNPSDYHRFHFPCNCYPSAPELINGYLYSVNPWALRQNINIFTENKRYLISLNTKYFGEILFIPVGATCVGAVHWTHVAEQKYLKGEEVGYFSFGASSIIMLFEPNCIAFDEDLLGASAKHLETKALFGQSLGSSIQ